MDNEKKYPKNTSYVLKILRILNQAILVTSFVAEEGGSIENPEPIYCPEID